MLTFWQGSNLGGRSSGTDYIDNDRYRQIASVNAGDGLSADGHEFLLTNQGDAWIIAYESSTANLTSIGGAANQAVINGVVQEIDIGPARCCSPGTAPTTSRTGSPNSHCQHRRVRRGTGSTFSCFGCRRAGADTVRSKIAFARAARFVKKTA